MLDELADAVLLADVLEAEVEEEVLVEAVALVELEVDTLCVEVLPLDVEEWPVDVEAPELPDAELLDEPPLDQS